MTYTNLLAAGVLAAVATLAVAAESPTESTSPPASAATDGGGGTKAAKPMKRHDHASERSGPSAPRAVASAPDETKMKRHNHLRDMK